MEGVNGLDWWQGVHGWLEGIDGFDRRQGFNGWLERVDRRRRVEGFNRLDRWQECDGRYGIGREGRRRFERIRRRQLGFGGCGRL